VKILYFAWLRERVGMGEEDVTPPPAVQTVSQLMDWLTQRSAVHAAAFKDRKLIRCAVDQVHSADSMSVSGAKEVAFFPPVTGG
jgi:molybdopterin synthase sulfur carrier subunit